MGILKGKAVVVTGAGHGLGRAHALHAAASGASLVVNDVDAAAAEDVAAGIRISGGRAVTCPGTVAEPEVARALIDLCVSRFGTVDGLVNNAGVSYHTPPWEDDDPDRTRELIEVNVLGSMYCGTAAAKVMRAQRSGVIVNTTSGSMLGMSGGAAYSASKGAVASMTYSWAVDLAPYEVRVNAVSPLAWTRMMRSDPKADLRGNPRQTPERVAPLVTFLLSDLSTGINGQVLRFDGDNLHVVRQPSVKEPVLIRDDWQAEDFADAFGGALADALEPPPAHRWSLPPAMVDSR